MPKHGITGETFDHKIAAIFASETEALDAAESIRSHTTLRDAQVFIISPHDPHSGKALEPEDRGIWRTLVRSHIWLGIAGAAAGLILFGFLMAADIRFVVANAVTAMFITIVFGATTGMMLGGLITLRPDHMPYLMKTQAALKEGKYVVAVHATSSEQQQEAEKLLNTGEGETTQSL